MLDEIVFVIMTLSSLFLFIVCGKEYLDYVICIIKAPLSQDWDSKKYVKKIGFGIISLMGFWALMFIFLHYINLLS
jgi:hypothetical protein